MRVAVVDFHVTDPQRHLFHEPIERRPVDGRFVDLHVAVLDPGLVVVTRRQIAGHRDPDARRELRVEIEIGGRVVEAKSDRGQLIRVDPAHHHRNRRIRVREVLHFRGECRADVELEIAERRTGDLGRLENVDAARVQRTVVLDDDRPSLFPALEVGSGGGGG